jgi:hypothetical protein
MGGGVVKWGVRGREKGDKEERWPKQCTHIRIYI